MADWLPVIPGRAVPRTALPRLGWDEFARGFTARVAAGARVLALFGRAARSSGGEAEHPGHADARDAAPVILTAVLTSPEQGQVLVAETVVRGTYPSLTPACPQVHWFEREIAEQWGVRPAHHPWLKPIRSQAVPRSGRDVWGRVADATILPAVGDFYRVEGDEVHEVAVGPVHAGVIEPGHFRFQCHGEKVFHLEIALGYQHRGVERALIGGPSQRTWQLMQTLAGDTTVGHATAHAEMLEALAGADVPARALCLRAIGLELERLANHVGDLGGLAGDVGFLPTQAWCGRLRGDFLNLTALICGSRFGRSLVRPGGVGHDVDGARAATLLERLEPVVTDVGGAVRLMFEASSVLARFEETGRVSTEIARSLGLVGVAARASGLLVDIRSEFPSGAYRFFQAPLAAWPTGDVFARAYVRWLEVQRSASLVRDLVKALPDGTCLSETLAAPGAGRFAVSLVEGWRGEICHVALTGDDGRFECYKVVDPSFHNWMGLAMALRDQEISDFPLCNKSFNLSYCGHDL